MIAVFSFDCNFILASGPQHRFCWQMIISLLELIFFMQSAKSQAGSHIHNPPPTPFSLLSLTCIESLEAMAVSIKNQGCSHTARGLYFQQTEAEKDLYIRSPSQIYQAQGREFDIRPTRFQYSPPLCCHMASIFKYIFIVIILILYTS